jgi:hypothetical protein
MSRVTDTGFPSYTRLYRGEAGGSGSGINTAGQRAQEAATFRILTTDYIAFMDFVYGKLENVGGFTGALLRRVPLRHPEFDGFLATSYTSKPVGFDKDAHFWKYRDVTVTFAPPDYDLDGNNAFVTVQTSEGTRAIEAPPSMFLVGGLAPIYDPHFEVPGLNLSLTTHQVDTLPLATYDAFQRHVNLTTFWGFDPGTVLYLAPASNRTMKFGAATTYEVTHQFSVSTIPWNYGFTPSGTLADLTYAGGTKRYPSVEMKNLFA